MQVANVPPVSNGSSTEAAPDNELGNGMFLALLVAQLRTQSPFDPVEPREFVNQLVQFNTLEQIIGIRRAVEQKPGGPAA